MENKPDARTVDQQPQAYPDLLTEQELIELLRIPMISKAKNQHNVIEHLKRYRDLPRIQLCNKTLYPKTAVLEWVKKETIWN